MKKDFKGPEVKTGPNAGKPRTRCKNGQWRRKRSDAGKPRKEVSSTMVKYGKGLSPRNTHGPVVQSGPTAGQNRSKNKNGRWRKKRSDAGQPRKAAIAA